MDDPAITLMRSRRRIAFPLGQEYADPAVQLPKQSRKFRAREWGPTVVLQRKRFCRGVAIRVRFPYPAQLISLRKSAELATIGAGRRPGRGRRKDVPCGMRARAICTFPRIAVSICAILQFSRSGRARENPMKLDKSAAAGAVGLVMLLVACVAAKSAEVKVMAGSALAGFIGELGPEFERTTGHKLVVQYGLSRAFRQQIEAGEAFDLAILSVDIMDELVKQGKLGAGTFTEIARAGMGVAVRNGTPKPDINSVDAFRRSLLNAKSISYAPATEGGEHMDRMFERLGVAEQMKSKVKPQQLVSRIAQVVAVGDAELGIAVTSLLLVSGVELVGKIPEDLQLYLIFTATVGDTAKQPEAARALVRHLTSPAAAPVIKAKGWEPATR